MHETRSGPSDSVSVFQRLSAGVNRSFGWRRSGMVMLLAVAMLPGCAVAIAGVAGGTIAYANGRALATIDAGTSELEAASLRVFDRMAITFVSRDESKGNGRVQVRGRTNGGIPISILLAPNIETGGTQTYVRAGTLGDKAYSTALLERIVDESGAANVSEERRAARAAERAADRAAEAE